MLKPLWSIIPDGTIVDYTPHTITIDTHNRKNTVIRNNDIAISSETRPAPQEPKLRLINFVACKTIGEYNRNKRKIEKFCLAEKAQLLKTSQMGENSKNPRQSAQPNIQQPRKRKVNNEETSSTTKTQQLETSTSIDDAHPSHSMPGPSFNVSPILTRTTGGKKKFSKKSPGKAQKGKQSCIRKKATVSAARRTANTKLTKTKLAALKQSYAFQLSQNQVNFNELSKKPTTRVFKERSPGHTKPFIIATSSSAADFMLTPKRSTVSTIAKSPPMRNIRKSKASHSQEAECRESHSQHLIIPIIPNGRLHTKPKRQEHYSNRPRRYLRGQSPTSRTKHQSELHYFRTRHSHTILRLTRLIPHRLRQLCPHSKRTALRLHGLDSRRTRPRMGHKHPEHHNQGH